jgi:DNA-binding MarR family transcriptional regulator
VEGTEIPIDSGNRCRYIYQAMAAVLRKRLGDSALFALPCACGALRRAARVVTRLYDDALGPSGLEAAQFGLLMALHALGTASHRDLADGLDLDGTTLTRNLSVLRRRGLMTAAPGEDRRQRRYALTDEGRAAVTRARPLWERAQATLRSHLGAEAWTTLVDVSDRTALALNRSRGPARNTGGRR